jgi:hypothetical protein
MQKKRSKYEESFPEPLDAVKHINFLKSLDLSKITDGELESEIINRLHIIPFTSAIIPKNDEVFRARLNINKKPFTNVEDIYAPPREKVKESGRANKPGERIFYCASNFKLAAFEVIQNLKHSISPSHEIAFLTIGVWRTNENLHVSNIIYDEKLLKLRSDVNHAYEEIQRMLNNGHISSETALSNKLILEYFAEEFTKDNIKNGSDYRVSNFYIKSLRKSIDLIAPQYSSEKFDGINYPSIAMKYKGDNQAIFIESANTKLEIVNAIEVIVGNIDFERGDFTVGILHEAESINNGIITWKTVPYLPK